MSKNKKLAEQAVALLNEAFEADPEAILTLIRNKVPCNSELADHPQIVVGENNDLVGGDSMFMVSAFGLLTGTVERLTGYRVAQKWGKTSDTKRGSLGILLVQAGRGRRISRLTQ